MTNKRRGDAELNTGERAYTMRLTLGALAEIEDGLALNDLSEIEARLRKLRAGDLAVVAAALLRGGGHEMTPADVLRLPADIGAVVRAVTETFSVAGGADDGGSEGKAGPFPGPARSKSA
jgi:Phage tail tube protein, GTA-gp10